MYGVSVVAGGGGGGTGVMASNQQAARKDNLEMNIFSLKGNFVH